MKKEEIWKNVKGYENKYMVSNLGRVKSLGNHKTRKEKILKNKYDKGGYCQINLWKYGQMKHFLVHRLVAEAFIDNSNNKPCIDHIDGNPMNNRVNNLRWCTQRENCNNPITLHRMSETHKGKTPWIKGKHHTEETKRKLSKTVLQIDKNTGEVIREFPSIMEVHRQLGFSQGHISQCCNGKRKTCGGFKWRYATTD